MLRSERSISFVVARSSKVDDRIEAKDRMETGPHLNTLDALLPSEMAERAEQIGVEKTRRDTLGLLALAVLAGAFIAFGAMFSTIVTAGADGVLLFGLVRLLAELTFSLGLILVIVGGAELFMLGGAMVGVTYWFIYLRKRGTQ